MSATKSLRRVPLTCGLSVDVRVKLKDDHLGCHHDRWRATRSSFCVGLTACRYTILQSCCLTKRKHISPIRSSLHPPTTPNGLDLPTRELLQCIAVCMIGQESGACCFQSADYVPSERASVSIVLDCVRLLQQVCQQRRMKTYTWSGLPLSLHHLPPLRPPLESAHPSRISLVEVYQDTAIRRFLDCWKDKARADM